MITLNIQPNALLFFIDETGHHQLADSNYPIFGLGGCAVLGRDYEAMVRQPWVELKRHYFENPDIVLHAAALDVTDQSKLQAIANFFRSQPFSRFATVMKITTQLPPNVTPYQAIALNFRKRIEEIASRYLFDSVVLIFEMSSRLDLQLTEHFGDLSGFDQKGNEINVEKFRMSKAVKEAGLEVADFIIQAAGTQVRNRMQGKMKPRKDFDCIFRDVERKLTSYLEIDSLIFKA
jgi:hypothetical protein